MLRVLVTSLCFHFPCSSHPRNITPPASGTCAAAAGTGDFSRHCYHTAQYHTPASVQQQQVPVILAGIVITPPAKHTPVRAHQQQQKQVPVLFAGSVIAPPQYHTLASVQQQQQLFAQASVITPPFYHTPSLPHPLQVCGGVITPPGLPHPLHGPCDLHVITRVTCDSTPPTEYHTR